MSFSSRAAHIMAALVLASGALLTSASTVAAKPDPAPATCPPPIPRC
jgi:hypothetical protein